MIELPSNAANAEDPMIPNVITDLSKLIEQIGYAPFTIAPEKSQRLSKIREKFSSDIHLKDEDKVSFKFDVLFGQIFTSSRSLQHIWLAACYYSALYCEKLKATANNQTDISIVGNENIEAIKVFYDESRKAFKEKRPFLFPPDSSLLMPNLEYLELANEIFRMMCAFAILHEIGHAEHEHGVLTQASVADDSLCEDEAIKSQRGELQADKWGYDWILSSWREYGTNPKIFIKRTLGIIFAMAMTDEFRDLSEDTSHSSHPPGVDRLRQFYDDYEEEIEANEWKGTCFSAISLGLQLGAMNNRMPLQTKEPYDGIRDFLEKTKAANSASSS